MKRFKKFLLFYTLGIIILLAIPKNSVYADVLPENPWGSSCKTNEAEVLCQNRSYDYNNPPAIWGCELYEKNSNYRLLTYNKTFNYSKTDRTEIIMDYKFCVDKNLHAPVNSFLIRKILTLLLVTLLTEIPILLFFGFFKQARGILVILSINLLTVVSLNLFSLSSPFERIPTLVVGEILVIIVEILAALLLLPSISRSKIVFAITIANIASAVIGSLFYYFVLV